MLIDTHAHLTDTQYDKNRNDVISQLKENGVEKVFCVSYDKKSMQATYELAKNTPNIYAILGIHPEEVGDYDDEAIAMLREYSKHPKVIGIGEIGLDYHYDNFDKAKQKEIFVSQIKLAHELQLPICIHNRDSIGDCLEILKENREYLTYGGVVHCFSESVEIYREIKKLGLKISLNGILTFKNSVVAPKVCEAADIEDILIETDCPYLTPHPYRGITNEPKYTSLVAQKIAEIKHMTYEDVVEKTKQNALQLFKKANADE